MICQIREEAAGRKSINRGRAQAGPYAVGWCMNGAWMVVWMRWINGHQSWWDAIDHAVGTTFTASAIYRFPLRRQPESVPNRNVL